MSDDRSDIEAALAPYFDGFFEGDVDKLKLIFHPACHLYSAPGDDLLDFDMATVYGRVQGRTKPAERGDPEEHSIISIDQSGPGCAFAKVMICLGDNRYTDYLTLLKLDGRWQVVGKTFTGVPRPEVAPL